MSRSLLPGTWSKSRFAFGGSLLKGSHAKTKRVFNRKLPLHVVLKSSQARGALSFLKHAREVSMIFFDQSKRQHVQILQAANAGNHLHLVLQAPSRDHLSNFLRAISGRIAQLISSRAKEGIQGFWDARPFSRLVSWGKEFRSVSRYLGMNSTQSIGLSRACVRRMFLEIQEALKQGLIPRTPSLSAAGLF